MTEITRRYGNDESRAPARDAPTDGNVIGVHLADDCVKDGDDIEIGKEMV